MSEGELCSALFDLLPVTAAKTGRDWDFSACTDLSDGANTGDVTAAARNGSPRRRRRQKCFLPFPNLESQNEKYDGECYGTNTYKNWRAS